MVVQTGDGPNDWVIVICSLDPGKVAYNSCCGPYETELIALAKATHVLSVVIAAQEWKISPVNVPRLEFLRDRVLPRVLQAMIDVGLEQRLSSVKEKLTRIYSAFPRGAKGIRLPMPLVGPPRSAQRRIQLENLLKDVKICTSLGISLTNVVPKLRCGQIGDRAWQTCIATTAEGRNLWQVVKPYGTSITDSFSGNQMQTYLVVDAKEAVYAWTCLVCGDTFLCTYRGQGGNRKHHKHSTVPFDNDDDDDDDDDDDPDTVKDQDFRRQRLFTIADALPTLHALNAKGHLSSLASLCDSIPLHRIVSLDLLRQLGLDHLWPVVHDHVISTTKGSCWSADQLQYLGICAVLRKQHNDTDNKKGQDQTPSIIPCPSPQLLLATATAMAKWKPLLYVVCGSFLNLDGLQATLTHGELSPTVIREKLIARGLAGSQVRTVREGWKRKRARG
ncbi:hypothetical protein DFJ77DRAFT_446977 [Powellomyces hirtus]|nr:hypothetical protein DFJ77DRAFT_446977 [Powellomyces hirtus]